MITLIHDRDGRNHQRWSSLWQSIRLSWLLLFLLLLLLLGRLGLSLCLLVLLDQLVHLKKMLKNPKNIFNNIREMQNQEYYVASTWSAGRIFIWVFPFSLKKDSSSVGSWLMFFHFPLFKGQHFQPKSDQTWWVWQVQSSQGWAWSCRGSCWEPWCWDREPPEDWSHPPAIKNINMIEIPTWLSWWYIKTWPRLVIKRMSVLLLSCYLYSIYKRIQTNCIHHPCSPHDLMY